MGKDLLRNGTSVSWLLGFSWLLGGGMKCQEVLFPNLR